MATKNDSLKLMLETIYQKMHEPSEDGFTGKKQDFVFHMLDWKSDLEALASLFSEPQNFSSNEAEQIMQNFLYHASGHIAEAARLYDIFIDPFSDPED